jgi:hypothetical protein
MGEGGEVYLSEELAARIVSHREPGFTRISAVYGKWYDKPANWIFPALLAFPHPRKVMFLARRHYFGIFTPRLKFKIVKRLGLLPTGY